MNFKNILAIFSISIFMVPLFGGKEKRLKHLSAPCVLYKEPVETTQEFSLYQEKTSHDGHIAIPETFAEYINYLMHRVVRVEKSVDEYGNLYLDRYEGDKIVYFVKKTKTAQSVQVFARENFPEADDFEYQEGFDAHLKWKKMKRLYRLQQEIDDFKNLTQH